MTLNNMGVLRKGKHFYVCRNSVIRKKTNIFLVILWLNFVPFIFIYFQWTWPYLQMESLDLTAFLHVGRWLEEEIIETSVFIGYGQAYSGMLKTAHNCVRSLETTQA